MSLTCLHFVFADQRSFVQWSVIEFIVLCDKKSSLSWIIFIRQLDTQGVTVRLKYVWCLNICSFFVLFFRFGPTYKKAVFREYEKDFKQAKTHPSWLGKLWRYSLTQSVWPNFLRINHHFSKSTFHPHKIIINWCQRKELIWTKHCFL